MKATLSGDPSLWVILVCIKLIILTSTSLFFSETFLGFREPNILFIKWNVYFVEIILSLVFFFNCFLGSFYYLSWYAVHLTHDYSQYIIHFKIPGLKNPNISALCLLIFFKLPVDFYLSFSLHCNVFYTQRRGTRLRNVWKSTFSSVSIRHVDKESMHVALLLSPSF